MEGGWKEMDERRQCSKRDYSTPWDGMSVKLTPRSYEVRKQKFGGSHALTTGAHAKKATSERLS